MAGPSIGVLSLSNVATPGIRNTNTFPPKRFQYWFGGSTKYGAVGHADKPQGLWGNRARTFISLENAFI